ncbi:hypothetical protein F511_23429 [Dorcoceras hygrometricum]|uniref:Uncharacterized protein n=1 Tax=Dorcoceras hygrometricum TaxID=472368 RepID=A0A2Z7DKJ0_9LAMI|nr:hypothetical protein F511_23429 [Dorcoceras hygrometricum]
MGKAALLKAMREEAEEGSSAPDEGVQEEESLHPHREGGSAPKEEGGLDLSSAAHSCRRQAPGTDAPDLDDRGASRADVGYYHSRANGYSEEEHPAPFLTVNRAMEELSDEDEEEVDEDDEEDEAGATPPSSPKT